MKILIQSRSKYFRIAAAESLFSKIEAHAQRKIERKRVLRIIRLRGIMRCIRNVPAEARFQICPETLC